jgi:hypothetical protein
MMSEHYQNGHLRRARRRKGPHVWEYLWRETDVKGRRVHRTAVGIQFRLCLSLTRFRHSCWS